jgi:hypothetical protein
LKARPEELDGGRPVIPMLLMGWRSLNRGCLAEMAGSGLYRKTFIFILMNIKKHIYNDFHIFIYG